MKTTVKKIETETDRVLGARVVTEDGIELGRVRKSESYPHQWGARFPHRGTKTRRTEYVHPTRKAAVDSLVRDHERHAE